MGPPRKIGKNLTIFGFFRPTEKMGREGPKWGGDAFLRHKKKTSPTIWAERILILRTFDFWFFWGPKLASFFPLVQTIFRNLPLIFSWVKNTFRNLPLFCSWVKNIFRNLHPFFSWVGPTWGPPTWAPLGPTWAHPLGPRLGPRRRRRRLRRTNSQIPT